MNVNSHQIIIIISRGLKYGHIPRLCPSRGVTKPACGRPAISLLVGRETEDLFSLPNRFIFENANLHDGIFLKTLSKIVIKRLLNAFLLF